VRLTFPIITAPEPPRESKPPPKSLFPPSNGQSPRRRDILITCRFARRPADLDRLIDIDGTITSVNYLHVERTGEAVGQSWKLDERPLRSKLIEPNTLDDDTRFFHEADRQRH